MTDSLKRNLFIITIATIVLYFPVIQKLFSIWDSNPDYSHGYFIIPLALLVVWLKRARLQEIPIAPSASGLLLIVFGLLVYLVSSFGKIESMYSLSFLSVLSGLILYYAGKEMLKELLFPVLFLIFMFPVPAEIYITMTAPLKIWISMASVAAIDAVGITVFREGNIIQFANTSLEVTEACSGVRSIMTFLMTAVFLAYLSRSFMARTSLVLSVLPISFFINFIRVTGTGILAHHFGPKVAQGFFHEFAGAASYLLGMVCMLFIYHIFYTRQKKIQNLSLSH